MNHTPGPWRYGDHSQEVYDPHSGETICCIGNKAHPSLFPEANARLIAAAPELLEALKMVMASVPFFSYRGDGELEEVETAVRTAIAKAEGREL